VTLLQAILKEAPGFLEGREALRKCEDKITGGPKKKRGLFGTSVGTGTPSVSRKYLSQADKDGNAALQALEKELEKDPFNPSYNDALHDVAAKLGMQQTAGFALEPVRKVFPEEGKLMHKLAEFYLANEDPLKAAGVYEDIAKANPGDIEAVKGAKDATARASMLSNRNESGEMVIKKKDAEETLALEKSSRAAMTKDQLEEKRDQLVAQYSEDQNNLAVVRDLAQTYETLEDWDNAHSFYDWGFQISNNDVALKSKAGKMKDRAAEARLKELKKAVAENPDDSAAAAELEEYRKNLSAQQVEERRARVEENPTDPSLRFALGEALFNAEEYKEAIKHLQQATRNPHIRIKVLVMLGRTFDKMGMTDMAVNRFDEAKSELKSMDDTKKEVLYELGLIHEKQGNKDDALESFKQIYEVDYGYRDVAEKVESAYG
jgi:tetratricopeptide (TPR) repeat protein